VYLALSTAYASSAFANDDASKQIAEAAQREAREIISSELFGHYDVIDLAVLRIELEGRRPERPHDYGLATVTIAFSTKRTRRGIRT
jgi:hypothetical protein